jgi:hypothetical protein
LRPRCPFELPLTSARVCLACSPNSTADLPPSSFGNIISPPPRKPLEGAEAQAAIAVFKDEDKALEERLTALERIARLILEQQPDLLGAKLALPVYRTFAHQKLLEALLMQAVQLVGGHFKQWNRVPCRTLVGMCGIGKSAMMKLFACTISIVYPSIIPIYVGRGPC